MSEYGPTEMKRRTDGSIDIDFYAAKGLSARCEAGNRTLRAVPRLIETTLDRWLLGSIEQFAREQPFIEKWWGRR